jgi:predicted NAD-dependent protein-ADP-ribosyltransferase YbiA (DUF1768 family)
VLGGFISTLICMALTRICREVDGGRIEGTLRLVFIRTMPGVYSLTELKVYADGSIYCWEWVDLDGLRDKLRSGRVATRPEPGARVSAHHLAAWTAAEPVNSISAEELLGEIADDIDILNGRPDSTQRCLRAAARYVQTRAERDRLALRDAYQAIPDHLRLYALGDMDNKDGPLQILCTDIGGTVTYNRRTVPVTEDARQRAIDYFLRRDEAIEHTGSRTYPDGPERADAPTLHLNQVVYPKGWPADSGNLVLRNEYPAPVTFDRLTYPTVSHAYWALAAASPEDRGRFRDADTPYAAERLAAQVELRADWPTIRLAAMTCLLRAKFAQHPDLADTLLATGDASIEYTSVGSGYWSTYRAEGRNWTGRLLELVRAEIAASRAGFARS